MQQREVVFDYKKAAKAQETAAENRDYADKCTIWDACSHAKPGWIVTNSTALVCSCNTINLLVTRTLDHNIYIYLYLGSAPSQMLSIPLILIYRNGDL